MPRSLPEPEARAGELLWRAGLTGPPVDLRAVVNLFDGVEVVLEQLDGPGYFVDLGDRGAEILVKADDPLPRRRFTVAHELGHFILAAHEGLGPRASRRRTTVERWCDHFAASLLMPRQWLIDDLRGARNDVLSFVVRAPRRYCVSSAALRLRLSRITPLDLFLITLKDDIAVEHAYAASERLGARRAVLKAALRDIDVARVRGEQRLMAGNTQIVMRPLGRQSSMWLAAMFDCHAAFTQTTSAA